METTCLARPGGAHRVEGAAGARRRGERVTGVASDLERRAGAVGRTPFRRGSHAVRSTPQGLVDSR